MVLSLHRFFSASFLGFNKRRAELIQLGAAKGTRKNLQEYSASMIEQIQSIVTANAVLSYALYTVLGTNQWMTPNPSPMCSTVYSDISISLSKREKVVHRMKHSRKTGLLILTVLLYILTAVGVIWATTNDLLPALSQ